MFNEIEMSDISEQIYLPFTFVMLDIVFYPHPI